MLTMSWLLCTELSRPFRPEGLAALVTESITCRDEISTILQAERCVGDISGAGEKGSHVISQREALQVAHC